VGRVNALGDREAGPEPRRLTHGPLEQYLADWHLWRAVQRDAQLTDAERDAVFRVTAERLGYPGAGLWDAR
jgi:hypothetical protein